MLPEGPAVPTHGSPLALAVDEYVDEADTAEDMQALARQRCLKRARRLQIVPEDFAETNEEKVAAIRLGLTGVKPTPGGSNEAC